jgi:hypothetical protein
MYIDDNVNTLLYAAKAQVISNDPIINDDPKVKRMKELQSHVGSLMDQLKQANKAIEFFKEMVDGKINPNDPASLANLANLASPSKLLSPSKLPNDPNKLSVNSTNINTKKNTARDANDNGSEESANFYSNRSHDKINKIENKDSPEPHAGQNSTMQKIKECLEMADQVQKINIQLREENKEISEMYEKEKAKVFQLTFDLERRKVTHLKTHL